MDKGARIRWGILLSALASTVSAILYPTPDTATTGVSSAAPRAAKPAATVAESFGVPPDDANEAPAGDTDPFAPRGWQAPPPPPPVAAAQPLVVVAPVILAPAGPPELPFRFVGNFNDGADQVVYLARGDQAFVARLGDVLETNYKVVGVTPTKIEFEYLPTGDKQPLAFPAHDN